MLTRATQDHPAIKALTEYWVQKSSALPAMQQDLQRLLDDTTSHVGLVLCERLINMPVQVIPHMYRMLAEELKAAVEVVSGWVHAHYHNANLISFSPSLLACPSTLMPPWTIVA